MATMINMGLHVFHPDWQEPGTDGIPRGRQYSTGFKNATFKIFGTDETLSFPVQVCTKVLDVKEALGRSLMVDPQSLIFMHKQGCTVRQQYDTEEIASNVIVKGIPSFKPQRHRWAHPIAIIGSGYNGLKTCMIYLKSGNNNIVCFDRNDRVGGYCWITAANKTSKLQTEFASFHVWWGQDLVLPSCGYPKGYEIWPKKDKVLEHFQYAAEQYGVLPYIKFNSNVSKMDVVGSVQDFDHYYKLSVVPVAGGDVQEVNCSVMYNYPGSMTKNRIIEYPGEDIFDGYIAYGMNDETPYEDLHDRKVAILGNGAFAVENARTACEHGSDKVFLITRRKNLASPRVPCWFVHQGPAPTPGRMVLKMFEPMYKLVGFGDPWEFWSVHASSDRQRVNIIQSSRFGIGDVTFLAIAYGKLEFIQDTLKRCTKHTLHLTGGRVLEGVTVILKSLGLIGDFAVDRLHKMKQMVGVYCDGDWRRVLMIDAIGMNAANFTTFSTGIGSHGFILTHKFLHDYPKEYYYLQSIGLLQQLPKNVADESLDKPAYVVDVKFNMSAAIILESMCPKISQLFAVDGEYKYRMYHTANPLDKFLEACKEDWDQYQATWKKMGSTHEYVPYPYTREMIEEYFREYSEALGIPISPDGPPLNAPELQVPEGPTIGARPAWAGDEGAMAAAERGVQSDHKQWWSHCGSKYDMFQSKEEAAPQHHLSVTN